MFYSFVSSCTQVAFSPRSLAPSVCSVTLENLFYFTFFFYLIPLNYTFKARVKKKFLRNNVMSTSKLSMKLLKHLANRRVAVAVAGIRTTSKFPFDVSVAFTT